MIKRKVNKKIAKKDPICIDGVRPRPMFVDYKDLDMLSKLTNRHGRIVSRRKTGCQATSQHAVSKAVKRCVFMARCPTSEAEYRFVDCVISLVASALFRIDVRRRSVSHG